jgi:hypothetical protein
MAAMPTEVVGVLAAIEGSDRILVQQVFKTCRASIAGC